MTKRKDLKKRVRGETLPMRLPDMKDAIESRRFLEAVRKGERGLSRNGRIVALSWQGRAVIVDLGLVGAGKPVLQLGVLGEGPLWPADLLLAGLGR